MGESTCRTKGGRKEGEMRKSKEEGERRKERERG